MILAFIAAQCAVPLKECLEQQHVAVLRTAFETDVWFLDIHWEEPKYSHPIGVFLTPKECYEEMRNHIIAGNGYLTCDKSHADLP